MAKGGVTPADVRGSTSPSAALGGFYPDERASGEPSFTLISPGGGGLFEAGHALLSFVQRGSTSEAKLLRNGKLSNEPTSTKAAPANLSFGLEFAGANAVDPVGRDPRGFPTNFLLGNDSARWRTGVTSYASVMYPQLYPGIDLVFSSTGSGLKYEFHVQPWADPSAITFHVGGAGAVGLGAGGGLDIVTPNGTAHDAPPESFDGAGAGVKCNFELHGPLEVGFRCDGWSRLTPLTIDPFVYTAFLGGAPYDAAWEVALASDGGAVLAGQTDSTAYPSTTGAFSTGGSGGTDVFVARFAANGSSLQYLTYIGGSGGDAAFSLAVDPLDTVVVTGYTGSFDFPTTEGAFDRQHDSGIDAFVLKLDSAGSSLVFSTFLGGGRDDEATSVALDGSGHAWVVGYTDSVGFPTTAGAFQAKYKGIDSYGDAFVTKLDPTGSTLVYSTFLGGWVEDQAVSVAVDAQGNAFVAGRTLSQDFPTTPGAFQTTYHDPPVEPVGEYLILDGYNHSEAFVAKFDGLTGALDYSTYLGGSEYEAGESIAVGPDGTAYLTGYSWSPDFPFTSDAMNRTRSTFGDAFLAVIAPNGSALEYASFLGGEADNLPLCVALGPGGLVYVVGWTTSDFLPSTPLADAIAIRLPSDGFLMVLGRQGRDVLYSTYIGGNGDDSADWVAVGNSGDAFVVGRSWGDLVAADHNLDMSTGSPRLFVMRVDPGLPALDLTRGTYLGGRVQTSASGPTGLLLGIDGGAIWRTSDGLNWSAESGAPLLPGPYGIAEWNGSVFVVQASGGLPTGKISVYRENASSLGWARSYQATGVPASDVFAVQAFAGFLFAASCTAQAGGGNAVLLRSRDGSNWSIVNYTFGKGPCSAQSMIVWNGQLYAALYSGEILRTADGFKWTLVARSTHPQTFVDAGQVLYVGTDGGSRIMVSADGRQWEDFDYVPIGATTGAGDYWHGGLWWAGVTWVDDYYGFVAKLTSAGFRNVFSQPHVNTTALRFVDGRIVAADENGWIRYSERFVELGPSIEWSSPEGKRGDDIRVTFADFAPFANVTVVLTDPKEKVVLSKTVRVDGAGGLDLQIAPVDEWITGAYSLTATGESAERQLNGSYLWSIASPWNYTARPAVVSAATGPAGVLRRGTQADWNVTLTNNYPSNQSLVLGLSLLDKDQEPYGPVYSSVVLAPGDSVSVRLRWTIPANATAGAFTTKVLVMTDYPRNGGATIAVFGFQIQVV